MDQQKSCSLKLAPKRRGKDEHMFFSLIYFFAPFSIFYITHADYVIRQAVPHAIPQTRSAFTLTVSSWRVSRKQQGNTFVLR